MTDSVDIYAMGNPALCAVVLSAFALGYKDGSGDWPQTPIMFLPVPIVLSNRVARTFKGTNRRTGLLEWLAREPQVAAFAGPRILATRDMSQRGLLFGLRYRMLLFDPSGSIAVPSRTRRRINRRDITASVRKRLKLATRLGRWIGEVRSPATVFHSFGVIP